MTAAVDFGDKVAAQESVDALRVNPQVLAAGVYDSWDRRFAGYARAQMLLPAQLPRIKAQDKSLVQASVPVMRSGTKIGTVYLAGAIDPLSRRLSRYAMIALLVVMTSLVLAVLGYGQAALGRVNRTLAAAIANCSFRWKSCIVPKSSFVRRKRCRRSAS